MENGSSSASASSRIISLDRFRQSHAIESAAVCPPREPPSGPPKPPAKPAQCFRQVSLDQWWAKFNVEWVRGALVICGKPRHLYSTEKQIAEALMVRAEALFDYVFEKPSQHTRNRDVIIRDSAGKRAHFSRIAKWLGMAPSTVSRNAKLLGRSRIIVNLGTDTALNLALNGDLYAWDIGLLQKIRKEHVR